MSPLIKKNTNGRDFKRQHTTTNIELKLYNKHVLLDHMNKTPHKNNQKEVTVCERKQKIGKGKLQAVHMYLHDILTTPYAKKTL